MGNENIFYVGVKDPVEVRKSVLEASKEVIELMKRYEHIVELKEKRVNKMNQLKEISRDIAKLSSKLKLALPSIDSLAKQSEKEIRRTSKTMEPQQKEAMKARDKIGKTISPKSVSEVRRLERELMDIEAKLKKISK